MKLRTFLRHLKKLVGPEGEFKATIDQSERIRLKRKRKFYCPITAAVQQLKGEIVPVGEYYCVATELLKMDGRLADDIASAADNFQYERGMVLLRNSLLNALGLEEAS